MLEKEILINNQSGLHARPAAVFVKTAQQFEANITICLKDKTVNAKSLLHILTLGADKGSTIIIRAEGNDEEDAIHALQKTLLSDEFLEKA
ncbi:MAG: HPr family phosphocarrier protein [Anaerolineaceae bacterium]|nr:HPr family phosphocarrier protein [Anaerolineaceae bacterium]